MDLPADLPLQTGRISTAPPALRAVAAIVVGCGLTLSLAGYRFGTSNLSVYLLDALHAVHPDLLGRDWFTTQTLQYHAVFGWLTEFLLRRGWLESGFFTGYLLLLIAMHAAWFRIVRHLRGDAIAYLVSVIFFELSGAGTALGSYQFLQDAAFLPSNIASVALLWGIALGWEGKILVCGIAIGIAGLLHLNYAVIAPFTFLIVAWIPRGAGVSPAMKKKRQRNARATGIIVVALAGANILLALQGGLITRASGLPLSQFIPLYVKLRHPHHYDPASWPIALWISFLWPIPLAAITLRKHRNAVRLLQALTLLTCIALLFAGLFYISESLVQLSLYRFTIYIKLLTCIGAALWMNERMIKYFFQLLFIVILGATLWLFFIARFPPDEARLIAEQLPAVMIFTIFLAIAAAVIFWRDKPTIQTLAIGAVIGQLCLCWPLIGLRVIPDDNAEYVEMCDWISRNTPRDVILLVPPGEQSMRWRGQRAIVVDFKAVPQLSRELPEWRRRMSDVLGQDILTLPRGFSKSLAAADAIYERRPKEQILSVAGEYGARYVLIDHRWPETSEAHASSGGKYFLYDLQK